MRVQREMLVPFSVLLSTALLATAQTASAQTRLDTLCKAAEVACSNVGSAKLAADSSFTAQKQTGVDDASKSNGETVPNETFLCPEGYDKCVANCRDLEHGGWDSGGTGAYLGCVVSCLRFLPFKVNSVYINERSFTDPWFVRCGAPGGLSGENVSETIGI
ncbi:hypothetical protein JR316_0010369 [Psilocybe cubensis]|uniref:Uncharacterized protein n=2 Tax=Psilocybe cubensis TaxID=181762 RepID=A0A8H7XM07_PSICU|nr:hypothetical protein JR316_0010369 [Psilocybe cubensis]KAH9476457.1 hypothetical protein JR316_0010369 [Psilocybe cubensis]